MITILMMFVACDDPPQTATAETGAARACLQTDNPAQEQDAELRTLRLDGTIQRIEDVDEMCYREPMQRITIAGNDGYTYTIGFRLDDADGADRTPTLDIAEGDTVSGLYTQVTSFGHADGFVLSDADGLLAAVNVGTWGDALVEGDVPGVTVEPGDRISDAEDVCGQVTYREIVFHADTTLVLNPWAIGMVEVGGTVMSVAAVRHERREGETTCMDLAGELSWAIWR